MQPSYDLLERPAGGSDEDLRDLARAHPCARQAAHASRSYCGRLALIAWHDSPVGADLERVDPTDLTFATSICTPDELELFGPELADAAFVTSLWASKEALAKALGDALAYDPRRLQSPLSWDRSASGSWRAQQLQPAADHVGWLVWSEAPQNSAESAESAESTRLLAGRR